MQDRVVQAASARLLSIIVRCTTQSTAITIIAMEATDE
jgi:hypothetical protein